MTASVESEERLADVVYQAVLYRVKTHGESPAEAAAEVERYMAETHGIDVKITPAKAAA